MYLQLQYCNYNFTKNHWISNPVFRVQYFVFFPEEWMANKKVPFSTVLSPSTP